MSTSVLNTLFTAAAALLALASAVAEAVALAVCFTAGSMLGSGVGGIVWSGAGVMGVVGERVGAAVVGTIDGRKSFVVAVVEIGSCTVDDAAATPLANAGGTVDCDVLAFENGAMRFAKLLEGSSAFGRASALLPRRFTGSMTMFSWLRERASRVCQKLLAR